VGVRGSYDVYVTPINGNEQSFSPGSAVERVIWPGSKSASDSQDDDEFWRSKLTAERDKACAERDTAREMCDYWHQAYCDDTDDTTRALVKAAMAWWEQQATPTHPENVALWWASKDYREAHPEAPDVD